MSKSGLVHFGSVQFPLSLCRVSITLRDLVLLFNFCSRNISLYIGYILHPFDV